VSAPGKAISADRQSQPPSAGYPPGNNVGAWWPVAVGANEFPGLGRCPGVIAPGADFSVGEMEAVALGLDDGTFSAGFSFVPQAVNMPMPTRALTPAPIIN
jgi:hypothetical protein